jgi:hypothetical protein
MGSKTKQAKHLLPFSIRRVVHMYSPSNFPQKVNFENFQNPQKKSQAIPGVDVTNPFACLMTVN